MGYISALTYYLLLLIIRPNSAPIQLAQCGSLGWPISYAKILLYIYIFK